MDITKIIPINMILWYESRLLSDYKKTLAFLKKDNEKFLFSISDRKLEHAFKRGLKTPAYIDFLKKHRLKLNPKRAIEINEIVPITDKKNYIRQYSYEKRCMYGKFPTAGNIDESAGSTGKPTDWIRSYKEEELLLKTAYFEYRYGFKPKKNSIVISAWSTGPWATGIKFCELIEHFCLIKNTGTDKDDIKQTLKTFGTGNNYIIAGYPHFLQSLFESKFPWKDYKIDILTGGDGYSPLWPNKIKSKLKSNAIIVSSYGCSDIDIGIGFETRFAQDIREETSHNPELAKILFKDMPTTPMLFQYNPLLHYVHNLPNGEFAITHLDDNVASPKIKYNVKDIGRSIRFSEMKRALEKYAPRLLNRHKQDMIQLPFLFVVGRSDGTISLDGANVFPDQIDIILTKHFPDKIKNFKLQKKEDNRSPFNVLIELRKKIRKTPALKRDIEKVLKEKLPKLNKDYRESLENNKDLKPNIKLYLMQEGPFKNQDTIKYKYIESS